MVRHIVCFRLKDNSAKNVEKAAEVLRSMEGKVPQIQSMEVGVDFLHSPRSYDLILQVALKDEQALTDYQQDPYHCDVVKPHMHSVRESSVSVDYHF